MVQGQIAPRLTNLVRVFIGHYRGGVGSTTVATAMVFGSVSGSAAATVSAIGRIMYPELRKNGYSERFSIGRSEEHTSELQSLMRISYAVFCLKKKKNKNHNHIKTTYTKDSINTARHT